MCVPQVVEGLDGKVLQVTIQVTQQYLSTPAYMSIFARAFVALFVLQLAVGDGFMAAIVRECPCFVWLMFLIVFDIIPFVIALAVACAVQPLLGCSGELPWHRLLTSYVSLFA